MENNTIKERIEVLQDNIRNNYNQIKMLEEVRDLEKDPISREQYNKNIEYLRNRIKTYEEEIESLQNQLEISKSAEEETKSEFVEIPFVVAAMKKEEGSELFMETPLVKSDMTCRVRMEDHNRFKNFVKDLLNNQQKIIEWASHYKDDRDEWEPHIHPGKTIHRVIFEMADRINRDREENLDYLLPKSYSENFFGQDSDKRYEAWEKLKQSGGLLIIDAISLFYPSMLWALDKSGICSNDRVMIIVLSPINVCTLPPNDKIEQLMRIELPSIIDQVEKKLICSTKIGVGDHRDLQSWLITNIPNIASSVKNYGKAKSKAGLRNYIGQSPRNWNEGIPKAWGKT